MTSPTPTPHPAFRAARRVSSVLAASLPLTALAVAAPAHAGERVDVDVVRWSSETAIVSWVERDDADRSGRPGNLHVGGMLVDLSYGVTDVFGVLSDYQCAPDQALDGEGDAACTPLGSGELVHDSVTLRVDRKDGTASLAGHVLLFDHEGQRPEERLGVDLTWTSEGRPTSERDTGVSGTPRQWLRHHVVTTTWNGVATTGTVGGLVLGDVAGDVNESKVFAVDGRTVSRTGGGTTPPDDGGGLG